MDLRLLIIGSTISFSLFASSEIRLLQLHYNLNLITDTFFFNDALKKLTSLSQIFLEAYPRSSKIVGGLLLISFWQNYKEVIEEIAQNKNISQPLIDDLEDLKTDILDSIDKNPYETLLEELRGLTLQQLFDAIEKDLRAVLTRDNFYEKQYIHRFPVQKALEKLKKDKTGTISIPLLQLLFPQDFLEDLIQYYKKPSK